jgi:hypothetical protein
VRKRDPVDRRRHVVKLTTAGQTALERLRTIVRGLEDDFLAPLDDQQRDALHGLLARLASHHDPRCRPRDPSPSSRPAESVSRAELVPRHLRVQPLQPVQDDAGHG